MTAAREAIQAFLACRVFAVVGVSENPTKFGHQVFRCYLEHGRTAYPIHPRLTELLGRTVYRSLDAVPEAPEAVSIITPPAVTEEILPGLIAAGVRHVWMQPGAESPQAVQAARDAGLSVIAGGPCLLVEME